MRDGLALLTLPLRLVFVVGGKGKCAKQCMPVKLFFKMCVGKIFKTFMSVCGGFYAVRVRATVSRLRDCLPIYLCFYCCHDGSSGQPRK